MQRHILHLEKKGAGGHIRNQQKHDSLGKGGMTMMTMNILRYFQCKNKGGAHLKYLEAAVTQNKANKHSLIV